MAGLVYLGLIFICLFLVALPIALLATANKSSPGEEEGFYERKRPQAQVVAVRPAPPAAQKKDLAAVVRATVAEQAKREPAEEPVARCMRPPLYYCYESQPLRVARIIMRENHLQSLPVVDFTKRVVGTITMRDIAAFQQSRL